MVTATNLNAYEDSSEFDEDLSDLKELANDVQLMVNKPELEEYALATERNFGGNAWSRVCQLRRIAQQLEDEIKSFEAELIRVSA